MATPEGPATEIVSRHTVTIPDGDDITVCVKSIVSHDLTAEQIERLKETIQECVADNILDVMK